MRISDWSSDVCSSDLIGAKTDWAIGTVRGRLNLAAFLSKYKDALQFFNIVGTGIYQSAPDAPTNRSEEHASELQSLMRISYAVFCLKKKKNTYETNDNHRNTQKKQTNTRPSKTTAYTP